MLILLALDINAILIKLESCYNESMENKTARLTILIDPRKKSLFEEICSEHDITPSQAVRKMIRQYIFENAGSRPLPEWLKQPR